MPPSQRDQARSRRASGWSQLLITANGLEKPPPLPAWIVMETSCLNGWLESHLPQILGLDVTVTRYSVSHLLSYSPFGSPSDTPSDTRSSALRSARDFP